MSTVSEKIAEWVQITNYNCIPEEVLDIAKRCILDFVGVALAGSREETARIVRQYLNEVNGKGEATVIGLGIKAPLLKLLSPTEQLVIALITRISSSLCHRLEGHMLRR